MTRPSWFGRAVRNRHRHAIEQTSRRWRGGRRDGSARTRRKILISAQVPSYVAYQQTPLQTFWPVVLLYVGIVEIFSVFTFENPFGKGGFWTLKDDRVRRPRPKRRAATRNDVVRLVDWLHDLGREPRGGLTRVSLRRCPATSAGTPWTCTLRTPRAA